MKTYLTKSPQQIDEFGTSLNIRWWDTEPQVGLYLELYYNDPEDPIGVHENNMDFYFRKKEDIEEFIKDLVKLKEEVWHD